MQNISMLPRVHIWGKNMSESNITKRAIADGFKGLMAKKPFEKITIADITNACGLNRQTFYYHFQDKYELLNWIFYNDVISILSEDAEEITFDNWSDRVLKMLVVIKNNAKFYTNALNTEYGNEFRNYLFRVSKEVFNEVIDRISNGYYIDDEDKKFLSEFYASGISGGIIRWITTGMKTSPESIVQHTKNLVSDSKAVAVARYLQEEKKDGDNEG